MTRKRKPEALTEKEQQIMQILWAHGPMHVREMLAYYPEPRPHVNTVSTLVRILEQHGHVGHTDEGGSYRYHAISQMEDFRRRSLGDLIRYYFNNSYLSAVSTIVEEEALSVDDLKTLIEKIEQKENDTPCTR